MKVGKHVALIEGAICDPRLAVSNAMTRAIACAEHPAPISYYLRANPDIAERISKMAPERAEREIDKIDRAWERMNDKIVDAYGIATGADYW